MHVCIMLTPTINLGWERCTYVCMYAFVHVYVCRCVPVRMYVAAVGVYTVLGVVVAVVAFFLFWLR